MTEHTTPRRRPFNTEGLVLVAITVVIGVMAGAASFTHMHDWTMANSPAGTPQWFGWANAVVSDLVPLGVGLEVRRRRRHNLRIGAYPISIILAAAALSVAGQLAQAKPSITGWLLAAVPALGFLALVKLVLSSPRPTTATPANEPTPIAVTPSDSERNATPTKAGNLLPGGSAGGLPAHVVAAGRYAATNHRETTGRPITAAELAARISITPALAATVVDTLAAEGDIQRRINGHALAGGGS